MSTCPNCGQSLQPGQTLCPHCGMTLPPDAGTGPGSASGEKAVGCITGTAVLWTVGPILAIAAAQLSPAAAMWLVGGGTLAVVGAIALSTRRRYPHFARWLFVGWGGFIVVAFGALTICTAMFKM